MAKHVNSTLISRYAQCTRMYRNSLDEMIKSDQAVYANDDDHGPTFLDQMF